MPIASNQHRAQQTALTVPIAVEQPFLTVYRLAMCTGVVATPPAEDEPTVLELPEDGSPLILPSLCMQCRDNVSKHMQHAVLGKLPGTR